MSGQQSTDGFYFIDRAQSSIDCLNKEVKIQFRAAAVRKRFWMQPLLEIKHEVCTAKTLMTSLITSLGSRINATFHLPRKLEVAAGNDVTPELSAFQLQSRKKVANGQKRNRKQDGYL